MLKISESTRHKELKKLRKSLDKEIAMKNEISSKLDQLKAEL